MSQAEIIVKKFINHEMDSFHFQQSLYEYYKSTNRDNEIQEEILDIIKLFDKDEAVRKDLWRVIFAADRKMHRKIDLLEVKLLADKAYADNVEQPHPILLKTSASLAWANCDRTNSGVFDKEKAQIWFDTFKDMPDFKTYFEKEIKRSEEFELKCKADYPDYYKEIEEKKNLPIVESYEIYVPVKATSDNLAVWTSKEMNVLVQDIMKSFHALGLQGYMDSFKNKCMHSKIDFQNGFIFTFDCYEKIEDLNKAKKDFLGQLSSGWGSGASQIKLLIGKEEVSLDWDLDQISDFIIKQPKTLNANKIK